MITKDISGYYQFYPCIVTLVGAYMKDRVNFMAAAWNAGLSFNPPLFGVSIHPKRFTHDMIVDSGEFTCNFLSIEHIDIIHGTGRVSGRDYDKVKLFSIPLEKSKVINCPTIESAYAAYECKLVHRYPVGDHNFFVGKVVAVHYNKNVLTGKNLLNPEKINFSLYLGSNSYISADPDSVQIMPSEIEIPMPQ